MGFAEIGKGAYGTGTEARGGADETYYFAGQELLEFSIVNIPSNPDATKRALRDQASHALMFVKRAIPELSFADIESLTVAEVLRKLDKATSRTAPAEEAGEETIETPPAGDAQRAVRLRLAAAY